MTSDPPLIVTGAGGRIGRLLRHLWSDSCIWLTRSDWDILQGDPPPLPHGGVWLDLAGTTRGDVSENPAIAARVADAAQALGARLFYMSSASVYPGGESDMVETQTCQPLSPYGQSKLAAEARVGNATILRLGNLAGADALLGSDRPHTTLDPVPGQAGGPVRSYIGPHVLAKVVRQLCSNRDRLPRVINIAQPGPVTMGGLLDEAGRSWSFGPKKDGVLARVVLSTDRLCQFADVPPTNAMDLVADLNRLGGWPT